MNERLRLQLETDLTELRLSAVRQHYQQTAQQATEENWNYETYLAALVRQEGERRTRNRLQRRISEAHFPLHKELVDFDFTLLPHLNKARILELAEGGYMDTAESVILLGNPGLGKTQPGKYPPQHNLCRTGDSDRHRSASSPA